VALSFAGTDGVTTSTSTGGWIPWILPGTTSDANYEIDVRVVAAPWC
jgi:hypothetical protein